MRCINYLFNCNAALESEGLISGSDCPSVKINWACFAPTSRFNCQTCLYHHFLPHLLVVCQCISRFNICRLCKKRKKKKKKTK